MLAAEQKILALCGGVGGAKLALGLSHVLPPEQLTIAVNTGDDFHHYGLLICPDLDTVMYTLAGVSNTRQGWGRQGESWHVLETLKTLQGETWFQLGDRDLAVHLQRRALLDSGATLSEATAQLCAALGVRHQVVPMSDQAVSTVIETAAGPLPFQHYFVREQCRPVMTGYHFAGVAAAQPAPQLAALLADPQLAAVVICPSNPLVSVSPILAVPGMVQGLRAAAVPVIVVSPFIAGSAIKGPSAKMFDELKLTVSQQSIADFYCQLAPTLVVDNRDRSEVLESGGPVHYCNTLMTSLEDRIALARECLTLV